MNLKPLTAMAALALAVLITTPASGQIPSLFGISADGENSSWTTDGAGTWWNDPSADTYNNYECSYLETGAIPGVLATLGPLTFDYEYVLESYYDGSAVLVSVDGGATWTQVESGIGTPRSYGPYVSSCLGSMGVSSLAEVITGNSGGAQSASIDLSGAVGPADQFQVRLVLASDYCCIYAGWTVSNMAVAGVTV